MTKLENCPFCGNESPRQFKPHTYSSVHEWVQCTLCAAEAPLETWQAARRTAPAPTASPENIVKDHIAKIMAERDKFCEAWIAETGLHPSECVMFEQHDGLKTKFWFERKPPEPTPGDDNCPVCGFPPPPPPPEPTASEPLRLSKERVLKLGCLESDSEDTANEWEMLKSDWLAMHARLVAEPTASDREAAAGYYCVWGDPQIVVALGDDLKDATAVDSLAALLATVRAEATKAERERANEEWLHRPIGKTDVKMPEGVTVTAADKDKAFNLLIGRSPLLSSLRGTVLCAEMTDVVAGAVAEERAKIWTVFDVSMNLNDVFTPGSDTETVDSPEELTRLLDLHARFGYDGIAAYYSDKLKTEPWKPELYTLFTEALAAIRGAK